MTIKAFHGIPFYNSTNKARSSHGRVALLMRCCEFPALPTMITGAVKDADQSKITNKTTLTSTNLVDGPGIVDGTSFDVLAGRSGMSDDGMVVTLTQKIDVSEFRERIDEPVGQLPCPQAYLPGHHKAHWSCTFTSLIVSLLFTPRAIDRVAETLMNI